MNSLNGEQLFTIWHALHLWQWSLHHFSQDILTDCPYLPNWMKALTQVSVAVKRINSWNKHFPIIVSKAHNWALSFWPSINNRVTKYILKKFNKETSDNLGPEHIQAVTQGNIIGQEALMIHSSNPLCSSTMSGLKRFQETLSGRLFLVKSYIWQLTFNLFSHYHPIISQG